MSQPRYGKWYTCWDKHGLVHITYPKRSDHRWLFMPWCDLRGNAAALFATARTPKNNEPVTCLGCFAFTMGWTVPR